MQISVSYSFILTVRSLVFPLSLRKPCPPPPLFRPTLAPAPLPFAPHFLTVRPLVFPTFPAKTRPRHPQKPLKPADFLPFTQKLYIQLPASTESRAKHASGGVGQISDIDKTVTQKPGKNPKQRFPGKKQSSLEIRLILNPHSKGRQSFQKSTSQKPYILNIAL